MSNYRFDFSQADSTLYDMNQINTRIKTALADMESQVEATLADWTGVAQQQYYASKQVWNAKANEMTVHLDRARATLGQISDNYGTTEQANARIWDDIRGN